MSMSELWKVRVFIVKQLDTHFLIMVPGGNIYVLPDCAVPVYTIVAQTRTRASHHCTYV